MAENRFLRECGATAGVLTDVEAFIASEEWVDMLQVFDSQLMTGGPSGLKVVAPLAGFIWSVDDPGGERSMLRYDEAVGAGSSRERQDARDWLLRYNCDDVEATRDIRDWMDRGTIPSIDTLDAEWARRT
jgi:predicted RecB family nuclease